MGKESTQGKVRRYVDLIRNNITPFVTVMISLYVLVRGQVEAYGANDIPVLLSFVVGLLGLNALEGLIDRKNRLVEISSGVTATREATSTASEELVTLRNDIRELRLSLDALHVNATATQLLSDGIEIPREAFQRARKIYWSGVTLRVSLRQYLFDLEKALSHDADLTFLIIDPAVEHLKSELAIREGSKYEHVGSVLDSTQLNFQLLAKHLPRQGFFRLGMHQVFPTYGLIILNPDDEDGVCYVEMYHPNNRRRAVFVVHATADASWFRFFVEQFDAMLTKCRYYDVYTPNDVERAVKKTPNAQ